MKILIIHNSYYGQGGEDEVVESEKKMLEHYGHEVILYKRSNKEFEEYGFLRKIKFFLKDIFWAKEVYQDLKAIIHRESPDIAHFHNVFFVLTSSAYDVCHEEKIPIVQTLHNYRMMCPIGIFYRNGHICENCLSSGMKSCLIHKCWKDSFFSSFLLVRVVSQFKKRKIFKEKVSGFICPSSFCKEKYSKYDLPPKKIFVKPNFLYEDPGGADKSQNYAVYVGALRNHKGVKTLIKAWQMVDKNFSLKIVGDGPLKEELILSSKRLSVQFLGQKTLAETIELIKKSSFLVAPSEWQETFLRVIIEAYACGIPVVTSRLSSLVERVEEGETGLLFEPGNPKDLAEKINFLHNNPQIRNQMAQNARKLFQKKYTMEKNYQILMDIYQKVLLRSKEMSV